MLTRSNIICCILSILLIGYLVVALMTAGSMSATASAPSDIPVKITVEGEDSTSFVTRGEVAAIVNDYFIGSPIVLSEISTFDIENTLMGVDNIESARCTRRANDRIWIEVVPMKPVARIFDESGSYYINRDGKRLTASLKYRSDVPVVQGRLEGRHNAARLMPLLDYIASDKSLRQYVTALNLKSDGDVVIIPPFRGHVVNFGAPDVDIVDKFDRLTTMYRDIFPVKGWDYYDTLSVKFRGQVVASRRKMRERDPLLVLDPEGDESDNEDISSMMVDNN